LDPFSFLETTTEISITFAGFVSIFLVLARRDGSFQPDVALTIRFILIASVASLFFAAAPLILATLGVAMILTGAAVTFYAVSNRRTLQKTAFYRIVSSLNFLALIAVVVNIVGWPLPPNAGIYLVSIWLLLGIASVHFLDLVFRQVLSGSAA